MSRLANNIKQIFIKLWRGKENCRNNTKASYPDLPKQVRIPDFERTARTTTLIAPIFFNDSCVFSRHLGNSQGLLAFTEDSGRFSLTFRSTSDILITMSENYLDIEDKFRQIRDLLALNWDNLTEEEEKEVNMSQISMHFFKDKDEVKRMYYEVNNIIKILKQATEF